MRFVLIILVFAVRSFAGDSNPPALFKLPEVLPTGPREIELMMIQFSDRANELKLKWQAGVATNQDWFLEQVKQAEPGKPLDYDPRLGVTKEEWAEYFGLAVLRLPNHPPHQMANLPHRREIRA